MRRIEFLAQIYCRQNKIDITPLRSKEEGLYHIIIERPGEPIEVSPKLYKKHELEDKVRELEVYYYEKNVVRKKKTS